MLLGSVTAKVLHDAHCPVFTSTHAESTPAALPPIRTILCAVDFGPQSEAVIRWAERVRTLRRRSAFRVARVAILLDGSVGLL